MRILRYPKVRLVAVWIVLGGLAAAFSATAIAAEEEKPNIVFILADDVGQEVLGSYGGTSYATPRLDRLAAQGIRFQHCYSMPVCHPSRICLLTGRYPFRINDPRWGSFPSHEEQNSLASVLKRAGYATAVAGKWQLALLKNDLEQPHRLGFDDYCLFGWHEGPRYYQPHIWQNGELRKDVRSRYGPDVYTDFLIDFIERHKEKPFFAFYSMALCHDVTDDLKEPVPLGPKGRYDSYKEMAEAMDERVGRLVDALERLELTEKTIVVFTTDNGTPVRYIYTAEGDQLLRQPVISKRFDADVHGGKGSLRDAGTRVPLIVFRPGTIPFGRVVDDLVDFSDFLPTFVEVASASLPRGVRLDGVSFASRLTGGGAGGRTWAFAQSRRGQFFVRTQRWKLYNDGRFFDAAVDPLERQAVDARALTPEASTVRTQLLAALDELKKEE